jgi:hypothetical protein
LRAKRSNLAPLVRDCFGAARLAMTLGTVALLSVTAAGVVEADAIVASVYADNEGVHIRYRDGTTVAAPREDKAKSLTEPALAADGRTVGWLANFDNCCQSYPVPLRLEIWRSSRVIGRIDADAMIWKWRFFGDGGRVGFSDGATHGAEMPYSYKLFDVLTGSLVEQVDGRDPNLPEWAKMLEYRTGR